MCAREGLREPGLTARLARMRVALALILAFALSSGPSAAAERLSLEALSGYLDTLRTVEAGFTQINADGSRSTGTLYLARPGRIRFEYDPPDAETLVVASGGQVAIFDGRAGTPPEVFPLRETPLSLILQRRIDLTGTRQVTGHGLQDGRTVVRAQDPEDPDRGRIFLYFESDPIRLAEWMIVAPTGEQTRTVLEPFIPRETLSNFLFDIRYIERERR